MNLDNYEIGAIATLNLDNYEIGAIATIHEQPPFETAALITKIAKTIEPHMTVRELLEWAGQYASHVEITFALVNRNK